MSVGNSPATAFLSRLRWFAYALVWLTGTVSAIHADLRSERASLDHPEWSVREISDGVRLLQRSFAGLFGVNQFVSVLEVDQRPEATARVRFTAVDLYGVGREPLPGMGQRAGAVAAINGGFGHGGRAFANSGILKINGEVLPFLRQDEPRFAFVGASAIGIDEEERWHFRMRPGDQWPEDWPAVKHAIAGGHRLLAEGEIHPSIHNPDPENPTEINHVKRRHPRTAVGMTDDHKAMLVTVDGRHPGRAEGMTLPELAEFMRAIGCLDAVNLDGGGSTTMWLRDIGVVNHPSDNGRFDAEGLRRLRNAIVIVPE